jgi:Ran GTPase-activating protein (RanGAP) involved in mRNA processing and transport
VVAQYARHRSCDSLANDYAKAIRDQEFPIIKRLIDNNSIGPILDLSNYSMNILQLKSISKGLISSKSLVSLNLKGTKLENEGVKVIAKLLKENKKLLRLRLSENEISDEGVKAISEALKVNAILTHLNIGKNKIIDEGMKSIGKALKVNRTLTHLNLRAKLHEYNYRDGDETLHQLLSIAL